MFAWVQNRPVFFQNSYSVEYLGTVLRIPEALPEVSVLFMQIDLHELTHFSPMLHFHTSWKRQETIGFLMFSGGIEMWHWSKMG